jgi:hypothetical protein
MRRRDSAAPTSARDAGTSRRDGVLQDLGQHPPRAQGQDKPTAPGSRKTPTSSSTRAPSTISSTRYIGPHGPCSSRALHPQVQRTHATRLGLVRKPAALSTNGKPWPARRAAPLALVGTVHRAAPQPEAARRLRFCLGQDAGARRRFTGGKNRRRATSPCPSQAAASIAAAPSSHRRAARSRGDQRLAPHPSGIVSGSVARIAMGRPVPPSCPRTASITQSQAEASQRSGRGKSATTTPMDRSPASSR